MENSTYLLMGIAAIVVICIPLVGVLKEILPSMIEKSAKLDTVEGNIYTMQSQLLERERAVQHLVIQRNQASAEQSHLLREAHKLQREAELATKRMPLFVHEIGEPAPGLSKFQIKLSREVSKPTKEDATQAVNPIWDHPNMLEVWARSGDEARQMADVTFPAKMGYQKISSLARGTPRPARIRASA